MEAFAPISTFRQATIQVRTRQPTDVVDVTDQVEALVADASIGRGTINIRSFHGASALIVSEPDPLVLAMADPRPLVGAPICLNVSGGHVQRRPGQRIFLVELDGPRRHDVSVLVVGGEAK
jgi:thiamine phosphate synthase YjbQ (UPF0047 family)